MLNRIRQVSMSQDDDFDIEDNHGNREYAVQIGNGLHDCLGDIRIEGDLKLNPSSNRQSVISAK